MSFIVKNGRSSYSYFIGSSTAGKFLFCIANQMHMHFNQPNSFLFSPKYHFWRHVVFWIATILFFSTLYMKTHGFVKQLILGIVWVPLRMAYTYPLISWALPTYLLKAKYLRFLFIILGWAITGWYLHYWYRFSIMIPYQEFLGLKNIPKDTNSVGSLLSSMTTAFAACVIVLFKHWLKKQQEWLQAEKEKVTAELQLLKAQVHPHFLFNTLNNIYSFSLSNSPKTPELILKLSSLLSYMLYDCNAEQVLLEKELEVMKDYIDLEKERYGNKIEISWNIQGDIEDKWIAPLLLLPFLENAFKHGTSEQLENPWLGFDLVVKQNTLKCKVANSKNEFVLVNQRGIGVQNVKQRLAFLYPEKHELKINDEGDFFVVSLLLEVTNNKAIQPSSSFVSKNVIEKATI